MELLDVVKARMAMMRTDSGWESFFEDLKLFLLKSIFLW
jgi:hypothetical protein